jgi:hypothetical protein
VGKTYKDSKNFNPSDKPKNKKSQKNVRDVWKGDKFLSPTTLSENNINPNKDEI